MYNYLVKSDFLFWATIPRADNFKARFVPYCHLSLFKTYISKRPSQCSIVTSAKRPFYAYISDFKIN